jgi:hypothetical protein
MGDLHASICAIFDLLGIDYKIRIAPLSIYADEQPVIDRRSEPPDQRVKSFVGDMGKMLDLNVNERANPVTQLGAVKVALKDALRCDNLTKVEKPRPVRPPVKPFSGSRRHPSPESP